MGRMEKTAMCIPLRNDDDKILKPSNLLNYLKNNQAALKKFPVFLST
jgi:hypothetical protein